MQWEACAGSHWSSRVHCPAGRFGRHERNRTRRVLVQPVRLKRRPPTFGSRHVRDDNVRLQLRITSPQESVAVPSGDEPVAAEPVVSVPAVERETRPRSTYASAAPTACRCASRRHHGPRAKRCLRPTGGWPGLPAGWGHESLRNYQPNRALVGVVWRGRVAWDREGGRGSRPRARWPGLLAPA